MNADAFKLPMLYKSVEDSVDKMLQADINYKTADEVTKTTMRNAALKKRLLATPGLAQYADATTGAVVLRSCDITRKPAKLNNRNVNGLYRCFTRWTNCRVP